MILLFMMILGVCAGVPIGVALRHFFEEKDRIQRLHNKEINSLLEDKSCRGRERDCYGNFNRCKMLKSTVCVDSLCPTHCNELHQDVCRAKFM